MLSETAFKTLGKNVVYDFYLNDSQKLEQKEKLIEDYKKLNLIPNNKITWRRQPCREVEQWYHE